jgi:hypothetical protein
MFVWYVRVLRLDGASMRERMGSDREPDRRGGGAPLFGAPAASRPSRRPLPRSTRAATRAMPAAACARSPRSWLTTAAPVPSRSEETRPALFGPVSGIRAARVTGQVARAGGQRSCGTTSAVRRSICSADSRSRPPASSRGRAICGYPCGHPGEPRGGSRLAAAVRPNQGVRPWVGARRSAAYPGRRSAKVVSPPKRAWSRTS